MLAMLAKALGLPKSCSVFLQSRSFGLAHIRVFLMLSPHSRRLYRFGFNWLVGGPPCRVVRQRDSFVSQEN